MFAGSASVPGFLGNFWDQCSFALLRARDRLLYHECVYLAMIGGSTLSILKVAFHVSRAYLILNRRDVVIARIRGLFRS